MPISTFIVLILSLVCILCLVSLSQYRMRKMRKLFDEIMFDVLRCVANETSTHNCKLHTQCELHALKDDVLSGLRKENTNLKKALASNKYYKEQYKEQVHRLRKQIESFCQLPR